MYKQLKCTVSRLNHTWVCPSNGYDTSIKVYNCVAKKKVPFLVQNKNSVTWYTCGPTVYDSCHLGHASCYVKLDIIQRILRNHFNLNLVTAMNITDIDDKIIEKSKHLNVTISELTKTYEEEFWTDMNNLNIIKPNLVYRVTENIDDVKRFIQKLEGNEFCYQAKDKSIYFDVQKLNNYGKLQNIKTDFSLSEMKNSLMDFALWKAAKRGEISWPSDWGPGRPGWHIECSALASLAFGSTLDVHAGGIDLKFPHHENEEAQSCAFHSKTQWVNYWFHTGHLHLKNSEKMSKSLKNTVSIKELLKRTPADVFRMSCVLSQYRNNVEFNDENIKTAENVLNRFKNFFDTCDNYVKGRIKAHVDKNVLLQLLEESNNKINSAFCDDFDTAGAVRVLNDLVSIANSMFNSSATQNENENAVITAVSNFVRDYLSVLGFQINEKVETREIENNDLDQALDILNIFRQEIRQIGVSRGDKQILILCDSVRDNLKKIGVQIKDYGKISSWSR